MLYWRIGQRLGQNTETRAAYGEGVMQAVAQALSVEFGHGFSKSVLSRAIRFYELCPDEKIVATVWQQLSWSHIRELLPVKDDLKRDFYVQMTILERWSVRTLRKKIGGMLAVGDCAGATDYALRKGRLELAAELRRSCATHFGQSTASASQTPTLETEVQQLLASGDCKGAIRLAYQSGKVSLGDSLLNSCPAKTQP